MIRRLIASSAPYIASPVAATNQNLETSGKQTAQSRLSVTVAAYHCYQTKPARQ